MIDGIGAGHSVSFGDVAEGVDRGLGEGRVVDMGVDLDELAVGRRLPAVADRGEQRRIGLRIMEGLARRSMAETPWSGSRKRTGPSMRLMRSMIQRPIAAFSSGVVRISVTCALWTWRLRPSNCAGTVSRPPKFTMSQAPTEPTQGMRAADHRAETVLRAGQHAAEEMVRHLRRGDVEGRGDEAGIDQLLEALPAGARGMEDEAFAVCLDQVADLRDAGRRHPEHGEAHGALGPRRPAPH